VACSRYLNPNDADSAAANDDKLTYLFIADATTMAGVGHHLARDHLQRPQRPGGKPARRRGVPASREQHVDDLGVLVAR
jgi:hypothetical protein